MKIFYLDEETTGTNPVVNDIIQLAGIIEIDGQVIERVNMNCQPFDWEAVEEEALQVNGMSIAKLSTFQEPKEMHSALLKVLGKHVNKYDKTDKFTLAGQKVGFDADFLKEFFMKCGDQYYGSWFNWRHVDLLSVVRWLRYVGRIELENDRLETIAAKFGISFDAHDAMADIETTRILLLMIAEKYLVKEKPDEQ